MADELTAPTEPLAVPTSTTPEIVGSTVERTIGFKPGTGGSSGVGFLQKALELTFFPELFAVRSEIGRRPADA